MQFSEDELKALWEILTFAEPLIKTVIVDQGDGITDVLFYNTNENVQRLVAQKHAQIRELIDPNGLSALKVKARDMLALVGETAVAA